MAGEPERAGGSADVALPAAAVPLPCQKLFWPPRKRRLYPSEACGLIVLYNKA
jgi:hypothetical protein